MPPPRRMRLFRTISAFILLLPRVATAVADERYSPVRSTSSSAAVQFRDVALPTVYGRQLSGNAISLALPLPTPTISNALSGTPIPLLIPPFTPLSSQSSDSVSRSLTSALSTSNPSSSTQTTSSGNSSSSAAANNVSQSNRLTAINFLPFIVLTSFFLISLMGWCLHGWCTRRPKEKFVVPGRQKKGGWFFRRTRGGTEDDELVCGPAYGMFVGQDVEEMGTVRESGRYKWPSVSRANDYRNSRNEHEEDRFVSRSIPPEVTGLAMQTVRTVPNSGERGVRKKVLSPAVTTGPMSPTSVALQELYEVVLRGAYDGGGEEDEEQTPLLGVGSGVSNGSTTGRKRKGHVREGSELDVGARWRDKDPEMDDQKLEVRNPSVGEGRLGLREMDVGYFGEEEPLPTPTRISVRKDVLPAHPRQLMSPPLETQFYFVPLETTAGLVPGRKRRGVRPKTRI